MTLERSAVHAQSHKNGPRHPCRINKLRNGTCAQSLAGFRKSATEYRFPHAHRRRLNGAAKVDYSRVVDQLIEQFGHFFEIVPAGTSALVIESQRLRYQVFCRETAIFDPADYADEIETDNYDYRSVHSVLRHKISGAVTGTVRLVLADPENPDAPFPVESLDVLRREARDAMWRVPRSRLGEISRFAVSKEFRRRRDERSITHGITEAALAGDPRNAGRLCPHISLGLIKAVFHMSWSHGITHWYAAMEPSLLRLLERLGIEFVRIGPLVDYFGRRQPCIAEVDRILAGIADRQPSVWSFITEDAPSRRPFH